MSDEILSITFYLSLGSYHALAQTDATGLTKVVQLLSDENADVRRGAARALHAIVWEPSTLAEEIAYFIAAQEWNKCVTYGNEAINSLIPRLRDSKFSVRNSAAMTLQKIGWDPPDVQSKADFYLALGDWRGYVNLKPRDITGVIALLCDYMNKEGQLSASNILLSYGSEAVAPLISLLDHDIPAVKIAAINVLGEIGDRSVVERLQHELFHESVSVQLAAIEAIEKIGDTRPIPSLARLLEDKDEKVRLAAAQALERLEWAPSDLQTEALFCVAKQNWEECIALGAVAVKAILNLAQTQYVMPTDAENTVLQIGSDALPTLIRYLEYETTARARTSLIEITGKLRDERATPTLLNLASSEDEGIRAAIAEALGQIRSSSYDVVPCLLNLLHDSKMWVCSKAASALGEVGDDRAVPPLLSILEAYTLEEDDWSKQNLYREVGLALAKLGWQPPDINWSVILYAATERWQKCAELGSDAVPTILQLLNRATIYNIPEAAVRVLGEIRDLRAVPLLVAILRAEYFHEGAVSAVRALRFIGDISTGPWLMEALRSHSNADVRVEAARALGLFGINTVIPSLIEALLYDESKSVRRAAAEALKALKWFPPDVEKKVAYFIALEDWNECVKIGKEAVTQIVQMVGEWDFPDEAKPVLITLQDVAAPKLMELVKSTESFSKRKSAAELLSEMSGAFEVDQLVPILADRDQFVRKEVAQTLKKLGWSPSTTDEAVNYYVALEDWENCRKLGVPAIARLMAVANNYFSQDTITRVILEMGPVAVPELIKVLKTSPEYTGRMTARVLELINTPQAVEAAKQWRKERAIND